MNQRYSSLREFAEQLRDARASLKTLLPLFSPCSYDNKRTSKKSLRHDANVRECFCVVADYDRGQVSFDAAVEAAKRAGIAMVLVTTPSHAPPGKSRWRAVAPLATSLHRKTGTLHERELTHGWLGYFPTA